MEERKYYIRVSGNLVEVSKEVYLVYYRMRRRERFVQEKERKGNTFHFSALDTEDRLGEETIPDLLSPSVESHVEERMTNEKLNEGIKNLPPDAYHSSGSLCAGGERIHQSECPLGYSPSHAGRACVSPMQAPLWLHRG